MDSPLAMWYCDKCGKREVDRSRPSESCSYCGNFAWKREVEYKPQPSPHYFKDVSRYDFIDVYRVLALFEVSDHAIGHAVKKLLCAGQRGAKDQAQDVQEAIDALLRWQDMRGEDD